MDYVSLGRRVYQLRVLQGMSRAELAKAADISASFVGHIERGSRVLSLETFVRLCAALRTDPNTLLALEADMGIRGLMREIPEEAKPLLRDLLQYALQVVSC